MALAVETDELGIAAGLQDRVTQAHGGLMFMDFSPSAGAHAYERLDPALLPPLLIAWRADAGGDSGAVHAPLRERHARGEPVVVDALQELGTSPAAPAPRSATRSRRAAPLCRSQLRCATTDARARPAPRRDGRVRPRERRERELHRLGRRDRRRLP